MNLFAATALSADAFVSARPHSLRGAATASGAPAGHAPAAQAERLFTAAPATLLRMFDEIDYGIALVTAQGVLRYANQLAMRTMTEGGPLRIGQGLVSAGATADQAQLRGALADAARGLRRLLHLGDGEHAASIAVVPVSDDAEPGAAAAAEGMAMLVFGKRQACESLTIDIFARTQKLTGAEASVLRGLCAGQRPKQIALGSGVAVSTVRTQINSIRVKTRTNSIRELVERVATLPPITPAMKQVVCH